MSLPTLGMVKALVSGQPVTFDGAVWTGAAFPAARLNHEQPRHLGTHVPADEAAKRSLDSVFPGLWQIVSYDLPDWPELPANSED